MTEIPELGWVESEDGESGFVHERRGRVPWLHLLAEDDLQVIGVGDLPVYERGSDGGVEGGEEFGGELGSVDRYR
jgi:hypothetical protein